jgi:magnesium transporter
MNNTNFSLQKEIDGIKTLLDKFRIEMHLIGASASRQQLLEQTLLKRQQGVELERHLKKFHVADLAALLEVLPTEDRRLIWERIPDQRRGDVLMELSEPVLESIVDRMSHAELVAALRGLDPDDLNYLNEKIPSAAFHEALTELSNEDRSWLNTAITYPEESVGHLMTSDMVVVTTGQRLDTVQSLLQSKRVLPIHTDKLFVIDQRGHLCGALLVQDILLNPADLLVEQVMKKKVVRFHPEDKLDEVVHAFDRYNLVSAPVVNERGKLVGRLTVDDVLDFSRKALQTDALNVVGVVESEDMFAKIWDSARNRWLWLGINLITAFFISRVIGAFEGTIGQLVALASLMPIIASVAGNTGNQTTALVIRGLALNQIRGGNLWHLLRKELTISLLNGLVWGLVVGVFAFAFYQNMGLSTVVTVAMVLSFILAAVLGVTAPVFLNYIGRDPAMGSSVILTGLIDALGFFVFLLLASLFLV